MGVLDDVFRAFAWGISTENTSTSILGSATSVAPTVYLHASYMERMQLFPRGTILHFAILALRVVEYPETASTPDSGVQSPE